MEGDEGTEEHHHRDILKEFVDQSFERAQEKDNVRRAREMPVSQNLRMCVMKQNKLLEQFHLGGIFPILVFQTDDNDRSQAMRADLVECLGMIEQSISGKIIDHSSSRKKVKNNISRSCYYRDLFYLNCFTNYNLTKCPEFKQRCWFTKPRLK